MATFNGCTIVPMPAFPAVPRSVKWRLNDTVASTTNPFTKQKQFQDWQGSYMEASLLYQPMNNAQAIAWVAWLMAARVPNIFQFGDPLNTGPQDPTAIAPTVSGGGQTGYTLITSGGNHLTPGDWIQIGFRLYRLTSVAGGTLGIWPQLRESPADGTPIVITNTQGVWRLSSNARDVSVQVTKLYGLSFELEEAI